MATSYQTPGVYIEEISQFPPSIAEVETAIPAFIGYTQQAIVKGHDFHIENKIEAVRITSLLEYVQSFGKAENEKGIQVRVTASGEATASFKKDTPPSPHNMYYSLQAFFANGGGPAYIVSVGKANGSIDDEALGKGLDAIKKEDEVTLIVFPEALALLSIDIAKFKGLYEKALAQCNTLQDRFVVMDAKLDAPNVTVFQAADNFRSNGIGINNLKYGAAYGPCLKTTFNYAYADSEEDVEVIVPKKNTDGAFSEKETETVKMNTMNPSKEAGKSSSYGQFYPLVRSAITRMPVVLPAAPLVVGVYAAVDNSRGVWKAPANVSLTAVNEPTIKISSQEQALLNLDTTGKAINAIRAFPGKGTLIWGARTLAGNDNEWRYVPVRRFFIMAEESIKKATEGFVFEPNDSNTWTKVRAMIENFLTLQWRAGALQGAKPEQSFYVKIGLNETMTALDILEGRMIIEIGMAVVRPAEFIILKFSHKMAES